MGAERDSMVLQSVSITTLVENSTQRSELLAEHGISFYMEADEHRLLFDTGQGRIFLRNAQELNIALSNTDAIVISHGHYDHAGGVAAVLRHASNSAVYLHPAALKPKYAKKQNETASRLISPPELSNDNLSRLTSALHFCNKPTRVYNHVLITGEIPRRSDFEVTNGYFFVDKEATIPDALPDDIALILETRLGVVIVVGCAHAGIVNTLEYVSELTNGDQVYAVLGGFHLVGVSKHRLQKTLDAFRKFDVQHIGLGHCTGIEATVAFWNAFPGRCFLCSAGSRFVV